MIRILTGTTTLLLAIASSATACNVPVFRYSLERWQPDRYEMVVIQRDPLTADEQGLIDSLAKQAAKCNLAKNVATIHLNDVGAEDRDKLMKRYKIAQLPWLIVRYPDHVDSDGPAYSGPIQAEPLRNLLESPVRTELGQRLLKGDSAVWLLLESGDRKKDDEVEGKLKTWLAGLEKSLKLPELTASPKDKLLREDLPLRMSFSVLRVSRTAAAEKHFVHILSHMEKNLAGITEPVVVPVFGRGMALYAIVGKGITERNVTEAATFVTGKCSCEVKQLNPGVDLLMTVDWDGPNVSTQVQTPEAQVAPAKQEIPQPRLKQAAAAQPTDAEARAAAVPSDVPEACEEKAADVSLAHLDSYGAIGLASGAGVVVILIGLYAVSRFGSNNK